MSYSCFWKPRSKARLVILTGIYKPGMMSLYDGNGAGLWDLNDSQWDKVQNNLSLRPQVGGFFDYGGTFNSLKMVKCRLCAALVTGSLVFGKRRRTGWLCGAKRRWHSVD